MDVVRFLLRLYQARGRDEQDVLQELVARPSLKDGGEPWPVLFHPMHNYSFENNSREKHRDIVAFLVQEAGANVWVSMQQQYARRVSQRCNYLCCYRSVPEPRNPRGTPPFGTMESQP